MIWNLLLAIPVILGAVGAVLYLNARKSYQAALAAFQVDAKRVEWDRPRWYTYSRGGGALVTAAVLAASWLLASIISTGIQYNQQGKLKHTVELVDAKREQRDSLLAQVRDELSAESFAALMAATPESDLLVIIGNQASDVLIERARLVVALNQELYALQNEQTRRRIDICTYAENPFTPRLFVLPGCPERE